MELKDLKRKLREDPTYVEYLEKRDVSSEIGSRLRRARILSGFTQEKLAKSMGQKQPAVARAESGNYCPSIRFLSEAAKAMGTPFELPSFSEFDEVAVGVESKNSYRKDSVWAVDWNVLRQPTLVPVSRIQTNSRRSNVAFA